MAASRSSTSSSDSDERRLLLRLVAPYLLVLVGAALLLDVAIERQLLFGSSASGAYKVHRITHESPVEEWPIIGTSRAKCCFIPDSIAPRAFNYGLNGADFDVTLFFLEQALQRDTATPVLLSVDYDWWSGALGNLANYVASAEHPAVRDLMGEAYHPIHRVPLLRHFGLFDTYVADYLKSRFTVTEVVTQGAGLLLGQVSPARFGAMVRAARAGRYVPATAIDSTRLDRLRVLLAEHRNRPVVLVVPPYHPSFMEGLRSQGRRMEWVQAMDTFPQVRVLDYSRVHYADSLYFDLKHLNAQGARRFNGQLRRDLHAMHP